MPTKDFGLILEFGNSEYCYVNIKALMEGEMFEPLNDYNFFRKVKVDDFTGTVVWENGLDLDPNMLYDKSVEIALPPNSYYSRSCENGTEKAGLNGEFYRTIDKLLGKYDETLKGLKDR